MTATTDIAPPETPVAAPRVTPDRNAVTLVRGEVFVVRRFDLPAGTSDGEVAGFAALQLEELSPFPLEQLYHGHLCSSDRRSVAVYAAYRRRFSAEQTAAWPDAPFVLPDFAAALRLTFSTSTVVLLRTDATLSALYFEADRELPVRMASRPLALDATPEAEEQVRMHLRELVEAGHAPDLSLRLTTEPERRSKGVVFRLDPVGPGEPREVFLASGDCWAMDVRDPGFVAEQRRRLGFDLVLWRVVLGTAAAMALFLLGEVGFGATAAYTAWLRGRTDARAAAEASIRDRDFAASRLEDFGRSGAQPFEMLRAVATAMPDAVQATRTIIKGADKLDIEGWAPDVASVNAYEAALRGAPNVQELDVRKVNTNTSGTTFTIGVTFKSGAFSRAASPPAAP